MINQELIKIGLSEKKAALNLRKFGENVVFRKKKIGPFLVFLSKFTDPLLLLMVGISAVSFFLGEVQSAVMVTMMVLLSAVLDFLNTHKSHKAVEKLADKVTTKITVVREGVKKEIDLKMVVPGDVVFLSAGNVIPADCRVLESDDFFVNQSSLTGESLPVEKRAQDKISLEPAADSLDYVFMGTSVVSGFAYVLTLETGARTQFGKIAGSLSRVEEKTDFERNMMRFSIFVMKVVFLMACFVFVAYLIKNKSSLNGLVIIEAITFALAITIGVTPDMLPAIITICLSKGSRLMAKKQVIVKQLKSIENFGGMDVLCTDKTGTLTIDKISLVRHIDCVGKDSERVLTLGYLSSYFHSGVRNSLDSAIGEFGSVDISGYKKIDEIPYDFNRKRSSMVVEKDGKRILISKGAPEEIVRVSPFLDLGGKSTKSRKMAGMINDKFCELSADGFRVLAIAYREIPVEDRIVYSREDEKDMVFAGFLAFYDPPKEDVREALLEIEKLGIEIKILTGDNELLTQRICREIGFEIKGILTGQDLGKLNDDELMHRVAAINVFARITPAEKERIIKILKKSQKAVGYLGDGINDAPALKAADVGISVDNAVDIAKDAADIILVQKSLITLKDGIIEGRKIFHNTMKYVLMGLSSNFGNMFSMMGAVVFLPFLPLLPGQILFNNFVYDASQFSLPTDAVDEDELKRPAHWDLKFIRRYMIVFGLVSSAFDFLTFYLLYFVFHLSEHQFQTGWLLESIATQTFVIYVIRTKKIPFLESSPSRQLLATTFLAVLLVWLAPFTFLGALLKLEALPPMILLIIIAYAFFYLILVEITKRLFYGLPFCRKKAKT